MHEKMPTRATSADRIAMLASDVREAAEKARRRCEDYAQQYTVTGYVIDDAQWQMGVNNDRTVTVVMRLVRPD
jgi:hypothetical protein